MIQKVFFGLLALCALAFPASAQECKPFKSPDGLIEYTRAAGTGNCSERAVAQISSPYLGLKCASSDGKMPCVVAKPEDNVVGDVDADTCASVDSSRLTQFQLSAHIWSVKGPCPSALVTALPHITLTLGKSNMLCMNPGNACVRLAALDPEAQQRVMTLAFDGAFGLIIEMILKTEKDPT